MPHKNQQPHTVPFQPVPGMIVRSRVGRDRFRVFLIIGIDAENRTAPVIVADGTLRKVEDRKHKNPVHLDLIADIGKIGNETDISGLTNSEIAEICKKFDLRRSAT